MQKVQAMGPKALKWAICGENGLKMRVNKYGPFDAIMTSYLQVTSFYDFQNGFGGLLN